MEAEIRMNSFVLLKLSELSADGCPGREKGSQASKSVK